MRFWKKVYVIYSFFLVRKIVAHMVTFCLYCVVLPLTILIPEVEIPIWGIVYIPSIITTLNAVGTPRSTCPLSTILCDLFGIEKLHNIYVVPKLNFLNLQVNSPTVLLDSFWECDVFPPDQGHSYWSARSRES